jgi:3-hydroxy-9,10-secoandrosta-1,3,5(10)-triene-9,17-dione monooxygenase reductase component
MAGSLTSRTARSDLTAAQWRVAMGCFPSGVTVVTTWEGDKPVGTTVNAFCSVSLEPPLLLICLDYANPVLAPMERCGVFGVNILNAESRELALHFSRNPEEDRFAGLTHRARVGGAPQLQAAPVFIDCAVEHSYEGGDHRIVVGRGLHIEHASEMPPLLYHKGCFPKFEA